MPPVIQNVISTVIPLLPEHPLSVDDQRSLRCLVALMIPASAQHAVPGADDALIFADILASLRPHAVLARDAMAQLHELSGACFADLAAAQQSALAQRFRSERRSLATLLVSVTVQCYYRDDRVMRSLDMEVRPPFPKGFEVEQGDWSLLDPVRKRAKMYRDAP